MEKKYLATYTEVVELTLRQVFLLKEIANMREVHVGVDKHNYLHADYGSFWDKDGSRSTRSDFSLLYHFGLIERRDNGGEGFYFRYGISPKGRMIYEKLKDTDTSEFDELRPPVYSPSPTADSPASA